MKCTCAEETDVFNSMLSLKSLGQITASYVTNIETVMLYSGFQVQTLLYYITCIFDVQLPYLLGNEVCVRDADFTTKQLNFGQNFMLFGLI